MSNLMGGLAVDALLCHVKGVEALCHYLQQVSHTVVMYMNSSSFHVSDAFSGSIFPR
jgi:hypothetical protein